MRAEEKAEIKDFDFTICPFYDCDFDMHKDHYWDFDLKYDIYALYLFKCHQCHTVYGVEPVVTAYQAKAAREVSPNQRGFE